MNILMMTNTYLPHVGGVARSVSAFSQRYRDKGHHVIVVAPEFEGMPVSEEDVVRLPAIQKFNGSDFSVVLPPSGSLNNIIKQFKPDIVHSHHPFLIGSTALRIASRYHLPHVFTHHTMYERYTHYVPGDSLTLKKFVIDLATHYANLCDHVFAPSESIADILKSRHVQKPISTIPTGVDLAFYQRGSGAGFRQMMNIPKEAFVVGHVGRLAKEKNLVFLARSLASFLKENTKAYCLIVGKGPLEEEIATIFAQSGCADRLFMTGSLEGQFLVSAYQAMDVFAFSSFSETQGMVLTEAMACGVPVIALDAAGVREVVCDGENGRLLFCEDEQVFFEAINDFSKLPNKTIQQYRESALQTAEIFSLDNAVDKALHIYQTLINKGVRSHDKHEGLWSELLPIIETEWHLVKSYAESINSAIFKGDNHALDHDLISTGQ